MPVDAAITVRSDPDELERLYGLLSNPDLGGVVGLDLYRNPIGDPGIQAIAHAE